MFPLLNHISEKRSDFYVWHVPFERSDDNLFDTFDNFTRNFFRGSNASLPPSAPTFGTPETSLS